MTNSEKLFIPLIKAREAAKVFVEDILYIETDGRKVGIHIDGERLCMYAKLAELEGFLDKRFYKCHSRCIINLDKVVKMKNQEVVFDNGARVYLSRQKFTDAIRFYKGYILREREREGKTGTHRDLAQKTL